MADGEAKLFGWTGIDIDIDMDGCGKSRSPRRSTLLGGTVLAVDAGVLTGASGVDCIGKTGGTAADSNGWKLPLTLQRTDKVIFCWNTLVTVSQ